MVGSAVLCPEPSADGRHVPRAPRFRTIQVYPKDVGGLLRAHSVSSSGDPPAASEFITLLGGVAVAWPLGARAQQGERMRRIGVLMAFSESNPQFRSLIETFMQGLTRSGWVDGRNVEIDVRWAGGDVGRMRAFAKQLTELQPDVILAGTTPVTDAL